MEIYKMHKNNRLNQKKFIKMIKIEDPNLNKY